MIFACPEFLLLYLQIRNRAKAYLGSTQSSNSEHDLGPLVQVFNVDILPSLRHKHFHITKHVEAVQNCTTLFPHFKLQDDTRAL